VDALLPRLLVALYALWFHANNFDTCPSPIGGYRVHGGTRPGQKLSKDTLQALKECNLDVFCLTPDRLQEGAGIDKLLSRSQEHNGVGQKCVLIACLTDYTG